MVEKQYLVASIKKYWPDYVKMTSVEQVESCAHSFVNNKPLEPVYTEGGSDANTQDIAVTIMAICQVISTTILLGEEIKAKPAEAKIEIVRQNVEQLHPSIDHNSVEQVLQSEEIIEFFKSMP